MKNAFFLLLLFFVNGCSTNQEVASIPFDKEKWTIKEGADYPYREQMYEYVLYNDSVRSLDRSGILNLLGEPDRTNLNYLYYQITEKRLFAWTIHQTSLVFKFKADDSIEWIMLHE